MIRALHRPAAVLGASAAVLALTAGCSLFQGSSPTEPRVVETEEPAEVDEVIAGLEPLLGDAESIPSSEAVFEALMEAGYGVEQLEATQDETPLETGVPSKQFAVRVDAGCVVGEIREGEATARLMPPSESTGTCMYGSVERPEGAPEPSGEPRDEDGGDNGAGHIPGESFSTEEAEDGTGGAGEGSGGTGNGGDQGGGSGDTGGDAGLGGN
ncbi:DUF6993 domain-containing protein [Brevibacterium album]|uniref:DUF6993 domain-containing protein n=1 Tax=Brevibacterium album TaxID=417948 RepID=UPI0003F9071E|nr:hypothetical protein [Brevibacterium album]